MTEMPTISSTSYVTTGTSLSDWADKTVAAHAGTQLRAAQALTLRPAGARFEEDVQQTAFGHHTKEIRVSMRFVKVFIVDPTDDLKLSQRVLHSGEEQLTDLTDQELFFELPIKALLDKHNAVRATVLNKKASERAGKDVFLEPVRVRDLKMNVTVVASF